MRSRSACSTSATERAALGDVAGVAVPVVGQLGDLPVADAVMVAPRQQRRPRRRAHRRRVEPVVARCPRRAIRSSVGVCDLAAERVGSPGPASSISTIRMFGASSGSRRGLTRFDRPTPASCGPRGSPTASAETAGCPGSWVRPAFALRGGPPDPNRATVARHPPGGVRRSMPRSAAPRKRSTSHTANRGVRASHGVEPFGVAHLTAHGRSGRGPPRRYDGTRRWRHPRRRVRAMRVRRRSSPRCRRTLVARTRRSSAVCWPSGRARRR